jgi:pimeloyl-ACP methyl ester carboxylesterase
MREAQSSGGAIGRGVVCCAGVWVCLLLAGCSQDAYRQLSSERSVPEFANALDRAADLPSRLTRVSVPLEDGSSMKLAIHETGRGDRGRVVVLVHGALGDASTWRLVSGYLGDSYDLMAVDLPGCGQSDVPDPKRYGDSVYTPEGLGRAVLLAVRERLRTRQDGLDASDVAGRDPKITLVGHSLGSRVILRMFGDAGLREDFVDVLARVDGVVLTSPPDGPTVQVADGLRGVAELKSGELTLASATGTLKEHVAEATLASVCDPKRATREYADSFVAMLRDGARLPAMQEMIRRTVPQVGPWERDWPRVRRECDEYVYVCVPCLILFGEQDDTISPAIGYKLLDELPDARLRIVRDSRHSLPLERPLAWSALVQAFIEDPDWGMAAAEVDPDDWAKDIGAEDSAVDASRDRLGG